jgi:vacuolar protein-sorting-associated protein 4
MTPCSPSDQGAIQVAGSQIAPEDLLEPPLQLRDFKKALGRARPSISAEEIKKHEEWKKVESQSVAAKRS